MKKTAKREPKQEEVRSPSSSPSLQLVLADVLRQDLREFVVHAGMQALATLLERERTSVCGTRYKHDPDRTAHRTGHVRGELVMGGRRVSVKRPRARTVDGEEVTLPSFEHFAQHDALTERVMEQMMIGVSTRRYARSLEPLPADLEERGTSKSAVSRNFVRETQAQMHEWLGRSLSEIDACVLMIDGLYVGRDHVVLVALAIDVKGQKHVLGMRIGATENATSVRELLADLASRGLRTEQKILVVIDGAKALAKGVREVFGERAIIQRCQAHKVRNVLDQLPEAMREATRNAMRQAYKSTDAKSAKKLLENLERSLRNDHPDAAGSLAEGLDETLTVMRFGLPSTLARMLSTTNAIENLIGSARERTARVKSWKDGAMILRWLVTAVRDASKSFRRIKHYDKLAKLVVALRGKDDVANNVAAA